jgi:hypothetical protein
MPTCFAVAIPQLPPVPNPLSIPALPASFPPNIPIGVGQLGLPCCFISIPAINPADYLPPIPLPPGSVINTALILLMEEYINLMLAYADLIQVPCPLE